MTSATSAYACYVSGNFPVMSDAQNMGTYSHFLSIIGHFAIPRNPNLPPNTPPEPDPYADELLNVRVHKYVGGRGSTYFSETYRNGDIVYAFGSGKMHIQHGAPCIDLFTQHLNNLTPPGDELMIESEDDSTVSFIFTGQCIEHRLDRVFALHTSSYDPQVPISCSYLLSLFTCFLSLEPRQTSMLSAIS
jgi:hypothetical protein